MAELDFPTLQQVLQRMQTDVQNELPQSNPYLPNSYLKAIIIGLAGRNFENFNQLNTLLNDLYLTTATDDFLTLWGSIWGLTQKNATQSAGNVTSTGVLGTVIPSGTILSSASSNQYTVTTSSDVQSISLAVTLTRTGSVVQAVTATPHDFATGIRVTISGATDPDYDGIFEIIVADEVTFTYTIATTPLSPDSGTVEASIASIPVESIDFGSDNNLESGGVLTYQSIIPGINDNAAYVQVEGLEGGQDNETNDEFRARLLFRTRNPVAQFSVSAIEQQAFLIEGVTRVWVQPITPGVGDVTVYFVRDNDAIIIPTPDEVLTVRNSILEIYPASSDPDDLFVAAPTPVTIDFTFSSLEPNTSTMRSAVAANLQQFFDDDAGVGDDILQLGYNCAIYSTIDPNTGAQVSDFSLTTPIGNVVIQSDEIGVLGDVNFS